MRSNLSIRTNKVNLTAERDAVEEILRSDNNRRAMRYLQTIKQTESV